jgi:hypothetical protein
MKPTLSPVRKRPILFNVKKVKNGVAQLSTVHQFRRSAEERAEMQIRRALNRALNGEIRNAPKRDRKIEQIRDKAKANATKVRDDQLRTQRAMELRKKNSKLSWKEAYTRAGKS